MASKEPQPNVVHTTRSHPFQRSMSAKHQSMKNADVEIGNLLVARSRMTYNDRAANWTEEDH